MSLELEVIESESLKDKFVKKIEELIISGELSIGEQLPPEREIASQMGISRTIVHTGIIELAAKGLVTIYPRKGTVVNDYRTLGTIEILNTLMNYEHGEIEDKLLDSILETRYLIEVETARLASLNRNEENLAKLNHILLREDKVNSNNIKEIINLDFNFHHEISLATANMVYPLIIKSFEPTYKNLTSKFYSNSFVIPVVFNYHKELYSAIYEKSSDKSASIMLELLKHGEKYLKFNKIQI